MSRIKLGFLENIHLFIHSCPHKIGKNEIEIIELDANTDDENIHKYLSMKKIMYGQTQKVIFDNGILSIIEAENSSFLKLSDGQTDATKDVFVINVK